MVSLDLELRLGDQRAAAERVLVSAAEVQRVLANTADAVQAASSGFTGHAADVLNTELGTWFKAASGILPALQEYAQALADVDSSAGQNESDAVSGLASSAGGGVGAPGTSMLRMD